MADKKDSSIETTIGSLVKAEPALRAVTLLKLTGQTRYHVMKLARLVIAETRDHFHEPTRALREEFGVKRPPTGQELAAIGPGDVFDILIAKPEKQAEFMARVRELENVRVTIPWGPITSAMLDAFPECTIAQCIELGPLYELVEAEG